MAIAYEPSSLDVLKQEGDRRAARERPPYAPTQQDFDNHVSTYRSFLRGVMLAVAHVAIILLALAFFLIR